MKKKTMRLVAAGAVTGVGALALAAVSFTANADEPGAGDDAGVNVIGGEPAEEGQFPYMVALADAADPAFNFCGGSLVAEDIVLTAAHCLEGTKAADVVARHGSVDLESGDVTDYAGEEIHLSEDYGDPTVISNDWALLKLAEPVEGAELLPIVDNADSDTGDFEVMGWGVTDTGDVSTTLNWATVPFIDDEQCAEAYGEGEEWHAESQICAGNWDDGGVDTCQGDSGGPMISRDENGDAVQVGIVSWGYGCAEPKNPGVYSQVSYLSEAINAAIDELGGGDGGGEL
ncbi:MAG: S1 family peptidase [Stackebrandtia sp.]